MLYIFDKDNTLVSGMGNRPANKPEEQQPLPGVVKKIQQLIKDGHDVAVASNQGGVSFGYITDDQARDLVRDACIKCGIPRSNFLYCPFMPGGKFSEDYRHLESDRKPQPGMLIGLMRMMNVKPRDTIMVGDQESDRQAARAAGVYFEWANEFFSK